MSLLLDALKDAEENRKKVEPSIEQPHDESVGNIGLETELELTLELDKNQENDEVQGIPVDGDESAEEENQIISNDSSDSSESSESGDTAEVFISGDIERSKQKESDADDRIRSERDLKTKNSDYDSTIDNDHAAEAVYKNRNKGQSFLFKTSLLVFCVCVVILVAGYYWLLKEPDYLGIMNLELTLSSEEKMKEKILDPVSSEILSDKEVVSSEEPRAVIVEREKTYGRIALDDGQSNKEVDKLAKVKAVELGVNAKSDDINIVVGDDKKVKESRAYSERDMNVVAENVASLEAEVGKREVVKIDGRNGDKGMTPIATNKSSAAVNIRKRHIPNQIKISVNKGKKAIAEGKWGSAENIFRKVLAESPSNTEALIYMAYIMNIKGEKEIALSLYFKALEKSPGNLKASVGLLGLTENKQSINYGSQLKQLITDNPDQAFLQANLGDYFVGRGEWLAAQAAYFEAFAENPENANYAFNLAVCLDQLGKGKIALRYYQQALALRPSSASRFDEKSALDRVQVLKGMGQ